MKANKGNDKFVIDPRDYRKDRFLIIFLILFLLIWLPATAFMTAAAIMDPAPFFFIWLIFGYVGTIFIPFILLTRNRKHILEVDGESLVVQGTGFLPKSSVRIYKQNLNALTLEHYDDGFDMESVYTLNLFQKPGCRPKRTMLASFVHSKDKATLLEEIQAFLQNHGFEFDVKNEKETNANAEQENKADRDSAAADL